MKVFKKFFVEFRSIFTSEDVLKENEEHANTVTASTMFNLFLFGLIGWILVYLDIFKMPKSTINYVLIGAFIFLLIPAIVCFLLKGKGKYIKYLLFFNFILLLAISDSMVKSFISLVMVIPIILAARYYSKNFTIIVSVITTIAFTLSTYFGVSVGPQDITSYNFVIPKGTTITIDSSLRDALAKVDVDEKQRLINSFIHLFLPKFILFNIVGFACIQISQSGRKMVEKQKKLSEEGSRIESELNIATGIQKSMLPSIFPVFPEHKEFDIYADMIPAKEVGGDFYDMFLIDDKHLAVTIADVSGKGVPAALIMMITRTLIKNTALNKYDVDEIFYKVNNLMCEGNTTNSFVTSWFGILDLETGNIEYVNAGHNAPLVYSKKENKFKFIKTKPNFVLAGMENSKYNKHELRLEPGDKLFLYTDGVVEATSVDKNLYGDERLINYLDDNINSSLKDTIDGLKKDIDKFVGDNEQFDDITMLELHFKELKKDVAEIMEFKANTEELDNVIIYLDNYLNKYNLSKKLIQKMELVIEELFVNICNYAYKDGNGYFKMTLSYIGDNLKIILEDEGVEFNPLDARKPDTSLSAEDRNIGGLGILLVKKNMDNIEYSRKDNKNILVLEKVIKEDI